MYSVEVSVVMPCYNGALYLKEAIGSVLNQSFKELELIVVNDGSTDDSLQIVEHYCKIDKRVKVINQTNQGQSAARNSGMAIATGKYLYFIDCDDSILPETIDELYHFAEQKGLEMILFDATTMYEEGVAKQHIPSYFRSSLPSQKLFSGKEFLKILLSSGEYRASVPLYFIKRELLQRLSLKFYVGIIHEDELFTPQLLYNASKVSHINRAYYLRRVRPNSTITTPFSNRNIEGYLTVIKELNRSKLIDYDGRESVNQIFSLIVPVLTYRSHTLSYRSRLNLLMELIQEGLFSQIPATNLLLLLTPNLLKTAIKRVVKK